MSVEAPTLSPTPVTVASAGGRGRVWHRSVVRGWLALIGVLLVAAALTLYGFERASLPNQYYAAAVFSMLQSWHALVFGSFDSAGFVTVDKPPLGFWIQAFSARLLGFSPQSVLLPEALAFIGSVALTFALVRRAFGWVAGLIAGAALAVMPISVVVSRNNTIDTLLVFVVLLAAWTGLLAAESGRLRMMLVSAAFIGVGFEIKMLQAYLVAPAIFLTYLAAAPMSRLMRLGHLALAGAVMLAVSLAWPLAVDLTPPSARPYVGSTRDNSAVSLAIGYNGVQRLLGRDGVLGSAGRDGGAPGNPDGGSPGGFGGGPGGVGENGAPSPLRLFNQQLGGQISWLLPLALLGIVLSMPRIWRHRARLSRDRRAQTVMLFGWWLLTTGAFFSVAEFWHTYYLVMLGPAVAALTAVAVWWAWRYFQSSRLLAWSLPAALLGAAGAQATIVSYAPDSDDWLGRIVVGSVAVLAGVLLGVRMWSGPLSQRGIRATVVRAAAGLSVIALLVMPAVWSATSVVDAANRGPLPVAGPRDRGPFGDGNGPGPGLPAGGPPPVGPGGPGSLGGPRNRQGGPPGGPGFNAGFGGQGGMNQSALIEFLLANRGDARYLVATNSANSAAPIILATAQPVMALGGFSGGDPILSVSELSSWIQQGEVRFFLLGGGGGPGGRDANGAASWVQANCQGVPADVGGAAQLYDCRPSA